MLFLKGGKGGFGNHKFKSSRNISPKNANSGYPGEEMWVRLRLNLIADVGIIGLPNVGKSSFLNFVTNANPKIGNYPFTTLFPNLGVISFGDYQEIILADIPGIIKNAYKGSGLGLKFLGHIEKCNYLLHFIDVTKKNIINDYNIIRDELQKYGKGLDKKKEIIVLTKIDLSSENVIIEKVKKLSTLTKGDVFFISINKKYSLKKLLSFLNNVCKKSIKNKEIQWSP